jgi:hypothetical protein
VKVEKLLCYLLNWHSFEKVTSTKRKCSRCGLWQRKVWSPEFDSVWINALRPKPGCLEWPPDEEGEL